MESQGKDEKNHFSFFFSFGENFECYQQFTHREGSMEPKKNEVGCGKFEKGLEKKHNLFLHYQMDVDIRIWGQELSLPGPRSDQVNTFWGIKITDLFIF